MNRVFFSGRMRGPAKVLYSPRGEKIVTFPLHVEEGNFTIEVLYKDQSGALPAGVQPGGAVMATGELVRPPGNAGGAWRVRANKIVSTED